MKGNAKTYELLYLYSYLLDKSQFIFSQNLSKIL